MRSRQAVTSSVGDTFRRTSSAASVSESQARSVGVAGRWAATAPAVSGGGGTGDQGRAEGAAGQRGHGAHLTPGCARRRRDQRAAWPAAGVAWALKRVSSGIHAGSVGAAIAASRVVRASALPIALDQRLGQEQQRDHAVGLVGERRPQVLFRLREVAAEESRHLVVQRPRARSGDPSRKAGSRQGPSRALRESACGT